MKNRIAYFAAVLAAAFALFTAVPAIQYSAYAAEAESSEVYAFSAEDDGSYDAADSVGPAYEGMDADTSFTDILYDYYEEIDTNLEAGSLDEATKEEIREYRRQNINDSLKIMGQGMLGIFVVMFLIYLVVVILNAVTTDAPEEEDGDNRS